MRVLVTGATGFLGCHTVAALLDDGHEVRVLARSPQSVRPALEPVGLEPDSVETLVGDVSDPAAVERAMVGCDAVVHTAAAVSLGPRRAKATYRDNVRGGQAVLGTAADLGLDPIVHVSGVPAMLPCRDRLLTPDSPPGDAPYGYLRSKVALEEMARLLQADGVPVVIVQPGLMLGPHDPKQGMGTQLVLDALTGKMPIVPDAGLAISDVRDLATAIARTVRRGCGPRRYTLGGTYIRFADLIDLIAEVAERQIPRRVVPARLALAVARVADVVQRIVPTDLPITAASAWSRSTTRTPTTPARATNSASPPATCGSRSPTRSNRCSRPGACRQATLARAAHNPAPSLRRAWPVPTRSSTQPLLSAVPHHPSTRSTRGCNERSRGPDRRLGPCRPVRRRAARPLQRLGRDPRTGRHRRFGVHQSLRPLAAEQLPLDLEPAALPLPETRGMFPSRDAVVDYLGGYARHKRLNVRLGIRVDRIERDDRRWALETSAGRWTAPQVIVATGGVRIADLFRRQPPCEARARFPGKRSPGSLSRLVPGGF